MRRADHCLAVAKGNGRNPAICDGELSAVAA
jgi:hypothetical protein